MLRVKGLANGKLIINMWICPKCKAENESLIRCENCGADRPHSKIIPPNPEEEVILETGHSKKYRKIDYKKLLFISGVVVVSMCIIIWGYVLVYDFIIKDDDPTPDTTPTDPESEAYDYYKPSEELKDESPESKSSTSENAPTETDEQPEAEGNTSTEPSDEQSESGENTSEPEGEIPGKSPQLTIGIIEYGEVTPAHAIQYSIPRGIIVFKLVEGSVAEELGLKYGDIITSVNNNKVLYATDVKKALSDGYGKNIVLIVYRNGESYTATITTEMQEKALVTEDEAQNEDIA